MKNKLLGMGMLAGLLTLALVMFGCDHNPRPWDGEGGGYVDPKIEGDWWFQKQGQNTGTLSITGGGEIKSGNDTFAFTASGGIIKINMGTIMKGEYGFSGEDSGTLSITGIPDVPQPLYKLEEE